MKFLFLLALCVLNVDAQGVKARPVEAPDRKIDAPALVADILGRAPKELIEIVGLLKIRNADGKYREVPIKWTIRPGEGEWHDAYQTPEKSIIPPELLVVTHRENSTNRYDYKMAGQPIPAASTNLFTPFGTSDFWIADFGLEFLHWPNPKHIKTEMRSSRPCYVIETVNPAPSPEAYARVLSWIDTKEGGLVRAESYDARNRLLKEFSIRGFKRVEGQWRIKSLHIRNDQTDTSTLLEFDFEVPVQVQKESDSP